MKLLFPLLLLANYCTGFGQKGITPHQKYLLDSIATQDVPARAPGIATAIVQNGKLLYEKCAGYADFADSSLITRTTRFNIASNGKQFTALAIQSLIDEGKLKLSDDIRTFFPQLFPGIKETLSLQCLLTHSSGIRDCYDLWSLQGYTWWEQSFSNTDVLRLIGEQKELNFAPGTDYLYSNTNYILLAMIVEKVSGKSFVDFTNGLFRQLNMPNTSFEADYRHIRGPIARSYFNFGSWTTYPWIWNVCGDGNLFTTLEDQIQWELIIQGKGRTSLKRALIASSQHPINNSPFPNYGWGLEFGQYKGLDYAFHEGATGAWKATVTRFPSRNTSIITLTNTGKSIPSMQTRQMADLIFGLKPGAAFLVTKPAQTGKFVGDDEITGTYLTESDFAFQFENRNGKIFLKRVGRNDVELEREADNIFHQKFDPPFKQEFIHRADGSLQVTAYYTTHAPYSLVRQNADFSAFRFESLNGLYLNTETGTRIRITHDSGNNYQLLIGNSTDTSTGVLVTPQKMLVDNYTLILGSGESMVESLLLNGDRVKRLRFLRKQ